MHHSPPSLRPLAALPLLLTGLSIGSPLAADLPPLETDDLYVSDYGNDRVAVYSGSGAFSHAFSSPGLNGPRGIVVAPNGDLYVASQLTSEIHVFDSNETFLSKFSAPELSGPTGMSIGPSGELYVSSFNNGRICVFALDGTFQRWFAAPAFATPNCVAFDSAGNIYSSSASLSRIYKWDPSESFLMSFTAPAPVVLSSPMGIARDACDTLYVAGGASHNILRFDTDGNFLGELTHPDLTGPQGVAFDERGHLFSASFFQHKLVEFDADLAYVQTVTAGGLSIPRSLAFQQPPSPTAIAYGCGVNPAGSLSVIGGTTSIGGTVTLGVDNPLGTQSAGAVPVLAIAGAPDPAHPCGTPIPGWGMSAPGAAGELLVSLFLPGPPLLMTGAPWAGAGSPAPFPLAVPVDCELIGASVFVQGALFDPFGAGGVVLGLTEGLELRIDS